MILYGRLKAFATDKEGNQTIFNLFNSGDYFGELSLLDDAPRSATMSTLEDFTVLTIDHAVLEVLLILILVHIGLYLDL